MFTIHTKEHLPLSGCKVWFSADVAQCKELKNLVELYGGKVCTRLSGKVNFVVARRRTAELDEKVSKYSLSVIPESFVRDSVKTNTPLPIYASQFGDLQQQKENYPNQQFSSPSSPAPSSTSFPLSSGLPYSPSAMTPSSYPTTPSSPAPAPAPAPAQAPQRHSHSIRERLKGLSLKSKHKQKDNSPAHSPPSSPSKTISKTPPASAHRTRMRSATRAFCETIHVLPKKDAEKEANGASKAHGEKESEMADQENPLQGLVFVVYGTFSISKEMIEHLIVMHGGKHVPAVTDEVTHLLFGGENMDIGEFVQAKERDIHIVNEYFLRLLIKY